jgi:hypothetical protein
MKKSTIAAALAGSAMIAFAAYAQGLSPFNFNLVSSLPGVASTYVLNIQGNASGTPIPVTATISSGPVTLQGSSTLANANLHAVTGALAATLVIKASAGNLYSVNTTGIAGGSAGYLVIVNATAAPGNGAITPLDFCYFSTPAGCSLSHGTIPINYSTGIVALITTATTPYTYTSGVDTAAISGDYQ